MPLDFSRIAPRLDELARGVPRGDANEFAPFREAVTNADTSEIRWRIDVPRPAFEFMPALPGDALTSRVDAPATPGDFTVLATDGSFMLPDRHSPARFHLLNIGSVQLVYGAQPRADLASTPYLRFGQAEERIAGRFQITDALRGARRAADELQALEALSREALGPAVALQDGSLILFTLFSAAREQAVRDWVLTDFLGALDALYERGIPVASYISYPSGDEALDALRIGVCDFPSLGRAIDCAACHTWCKERPEERPAPACDIIPFVPDRYLYEHIVMLEPGQRSATFASRSPILKDYGHHAIHFFFLHTGTEIARVEVPSWVVDDRTQLDLVHAVLYDQCRRGRGYPPALQEAHEQAVIQAADRRVVEQLVEGALARSGIVMTRSAKDASKRGRFV